MNEDTREAQAPLREESHPWLSRIPSAEEDDSLDEVIRYTLDEMRLA